MLASGEGAGGDETFRLVPPARPRALDGLLFYFALPFRAAAEIRRFRPDVIMAQSPHTALACVIARALARRPVRIVAEIHGDWRTATRLYGSRARRALSPLSDALAAAGLRRADAVRTVSPATSQLVREHGVEPLAEFPAYLDVSTFLERPPLPLPVERQALFVGVLQRYKNVDGLVAAWRAAAPRLPDARLRIVGDGPLAPLVERLVADLPRQTAWDRRLAATEVAAALDESRLLVLPSRSEGLPRIALEALCRGRPVLATRVGGLPDLIEDGVNGFLLGSGEPGEIAEALVRLLGSDELEPVAAGCRPSVEPWLPSADAFAERTLALVHSLMEA